MKIGLFGGSFDPIHRGHVEPVREARRRLGLERVIYLPTATPPHKPRRALAPALARFAMVELALLGEEGLYVSAHELTPERPAYTVETLEHFRRQMPEAELHFFPDYCLLDCVSVPFELIADGRADEVGAVRVKPFLNHQINVTEIDMTEVDRDLLAVRHPFGHVYHPSPIYMDGTWRAE